MTNILQKCRFKAHKMQNLVTENPEKNFRCPDFREEGGGPTWYQNVLIFNVLIRGGGRGSK